MNAHPIPVDIDEMIDITPGIKAAAALSDCAFCSTTVGDDRYFLYVTPEPPLEFSIPGASREACLLCGDCGDRVLDLAHTWVRTPDHPDGIVSPQYRIFSDPVDKCSWCDESLEHPILGVGISLNPLTSGDIDASYTLCSGCVGVFQRFLELEFEEAGDR